MEQRDELKELKKELIKQIKLLDKEIKQHKRTASVEPVPESEYSVVTTGRNTPSKRIQTKLNLLRKVVNHIKER
ncbi:hypothetical protein [Bacillus rhizoplanae]|uniref:hypothetical protein n=1 Tax=Bacillus rhizoplanae TaxID=2880966 RepID=UPI003D1B44BA